MPAPERDLRRPTTFAERRIARRCAGSLTRRDRRLMGSPSLAYFRADDNSSIATQAGCGFRARRPGGRPRRALAERWNFRASAISGSALNRVFEEFLQCRSGDDEASFSRRGLAQGIRPPSVQSRSSRCFPRRGRAGRSLSSHPFRFFIRRSPALKQALPQKRNGGKPRASFAVDGRRGRQYPPARAPVNVRRGIGRRAARCGSGL